MIYGAGAYGKKVFPYLKNVSYICDKRAGEMGEVNGVPVISPMELHLLGESFFIVICVKSEEVRREIKSELAALPINACVLIILIMLHLTFLPERHWRVQTRGKRYTAYIWFAKTWDGY